MLPKYTQFKRSLIKIHSTSLEHWMSSRSKVTSKINIIMKIINTLAEKSNQMFIYGSNTIIYLLRLKHNDTSSGCSSIEFSCRCKHHCNLIQETKYSFSFLYILKQQYCYNRIIIINTQEVEKLPQQQQRKTLVLRYYLL